MSSNKDGFLADPYANADAASSASADISKLGPAFGAGWSMPAPGAVPSAAQPDFLFPESADDKYRRSWGERLTYHIGLGYLTGLVAGGAYGIREGLKNSQGDRQRIRINAVLNSTGKHGPNLGNSIGCLGMMFSLFETIAYNIRGEDDLLNVIGAGALAGGVFKSQSGLRAAGTAAVGMSAVMTALTVGMNATRS
uniref:Mitochondrial import inner membrane translocase subunit TIM23 n=1 Tax=Strombidinopsis acuminata TaxID=141414 RepID=A0A7S3TJ48_9SPIT|mmetsp:Transcript_12283/g.37656  ORF Transcript_12283/g.37656 Transcript_12283/m.37656 type:complete len:195 (-) Transcript_12283:400-984(-)